MALKTTGLYSGTEDVAITLTLSNLKIKTGTKTATEFTIDSLSSGSLVSGNNIIKIVDGDLSYSSDNGLNWEIINSPLTLDSSGLHFDSYTLSTISWLGEENVNGTVPAFTVTATQGDSGTSIINASLKVVNDAPEITSDTVITIDEEIGTNQIVYTVEATDAENESITYSLKSEGDVDSFSINPITGEVTLLDNPDYETKDNYTFTVVATDASNITSEKVVTLNINNVNYEPVITSTPTITSINENSGENQTIYTVVANQEENYEITYSLEGNDAEFFSIDSETGEIKLIANPDFETKASYNINVVATADGQTDSQELVLNINNINEIPIVDGSVTLTPQNEDTTEIIITKEQLLSNVTDPENGLLNIRNLEVTSPEGATLEATEDGWIITLPENFNGEVSLSYQVSDGAGNIVNENFGSLDENSFNEAATVITFSEGTGQNPTYTLNVEGLGEVVVSFGGAFLGQETSTEGYIVTLSDNTPTGPLTLDPNAPLTFITQDGSNPTSPVLSGSPTFNGPISVLFSQPVSAVGLDGGYFNAIGGTSITAYDINGNILGTVTNTSEGIEFFGLGNLAGDAQISGISFYITGNEPAGFAIDNLKIGAANSYEVVYSFTVDNSANLEITPVNDAPTVANAIADATTAEDSLFNFTFAENTFADVDLEDTLTYTATLENGSMLPEWLTFDAETRTFSGTPANGDVGVINVKVTATDSDGATASEVFALTVTNVNDAPTDITISANTIDENTDTTTAVTVATLSTTDVDANDSHTYTITGGADADSFQIVNGELQFKAGTELNFENKASYIVNIRTTDSADSTYEKQFTITLNDVNEEPTIEITSPEAFMESNQTLAFSGELLLGDAGLISVDDVDAGAELTVTLILDDNMGLLDITPSGEAVVNGSGNAVSPLVLTGSITDINNTLGSLTYVGSTGYYGNGNLTVVVDDGTNEKTLIVPVEVIATNEEYLFDANSNELYSNENLLDSTTIYNFDGVLDYDILMITGASAADADITIDNNTTLDFDGNSIILDSYVSQFDGTKISFVDGSLLKSNNGESTTLLGGSSNDQLLAGNDGDVLRGLAGDDKLVGGEGNDSLYGGSGNDTIYGTAGNNLINGGLGDDTLYSGTGIDKFTYSGKNGGVYSGNDTIYNFSIDDIIQLTGFKSVSQELLESNVMMSIDDNNNTIIGLGDGSQITLVDYVGSVQFAGYNNQTVEYTVMV